MKRVILLLFALQVLFSCSPDNTDPAGPKGKEEEKEPEVVVPEPDYSSLTEQNHPRLLMKDEEFARMRARISLGSDLIMTRMHNTVMSIAQSADILNGNPIPYQLDESGKRLLVRCYEATKRLWSLSYAYRFSGEKKYLTAAVKVLNNVCDFPDWNATVHFLDPAQMSDGVSLAYDWLYKDLPDDTKRKVERCLQEYAMDVALNKQYSWNFYAKHDNWCTSCCCGLDMAALAIYEQCPEKARRILETSRPAVVECLEAMFDKCGAYPEGYGYWATATTCAALGNVIREDCLGTDYGISLQPGWADSCNAFLFMEGAVGIPFNYGDGDPLIHPAYSQWYYAWKYNKPEILYNEIYQIKNGSYGPSNVLQTSLLPFAIACASRIKNVTFSDVAAPKQRMYHGETSQTAVCFIRTGWNRSEGDKYLGIKGGRANESHQHMDVGSFVYDAFGERWARELGLEQYAAVEAKMQVEGYNFWDMTQKSRRWDVLRLNNKFHSTLVVNGEKQNVDGFGFFPKTWDTPEDIGATIDISAALGSAVSSCTRSFHLMGDDLKIVDEIETPSASSVDFRLVTDASPTILEKGIKLEKGGKTLYLKANVPSASFQYHIWDTDPILPYDNKVEGTCVVGFTVSIPAGKKTSFTTLLTPEGF